MYLDIIILVFILLSLIYAGLLYILNLILQFLVDSSLAHIVTEIIFVQKYDVIAVISLVLFIDEYFIHEHGCIWDQFLVCPIQNMDDCVDLINFLQHFLLWDIVTDIVHHFIHFISQFIRCFVIMDGWDCFHFLTLV